MSKFWITIIMLLAVKLMTSNTVNANDALLRFSIYKTIVPNRTSGVRGAIEQQYTWAFEGQNYAALIAINAQRYNEIRNRKNRRRYDLKQLPPKVYEGTETLGKLIKEFEEVMPKNWELKRKVNFVLAFVQSIPYVEDKTTGYDEFYKYPLETLAEVRGDCEDSSMLFASILSGLGFEVALFNLPGHIAVGVKGKFRLRGFYYVPYKNDKYYYCETTGQGFKLGMMPKRYENVSVRIMPITPSPIQPEQVEPQIVSPRPKSPSPPTPQSAFAKGKDLYYDARYNEAIKSLQLALSRFDDPAERAEVYIYLGFAEYAVSGGSASEAKAITKKRFQEALRQNPSQEFPGPPHPRFKPWLDEVRRSSIGELTIYTSPPQAEIWISGNGIFREYSRTEPKPINIKLFKGLYTVSGAYAGRSSRDQTVNIDPNTHQKLRIEIQPAVDDIPPKIELEDAVRTANVNQQILIRANVTDNTDVESVSLFYAFSHSGFLEPSQYEQIDPTKTTLGRYTGYIPSQSETGYIWYYWRAIDRAGNRSTSEKRVVEIRSNRREPPPDNQPPKIVLLSPPETANVNQQVLVKSKVTDNIGVESVSLFYAFSDSGFSDPSRYERVPLMKINSDGYTGYIPSQSETGYIWYYWRAIDRAGNRSTSEKRIVTIQRDPGYESKTPKHQGIWVNYAWSSNVFDDGASIFDWDRGDSISLTYLSEGKNHQTFGAQLDYSDQHLSNMSAAFQWGPALGESAVALTLLAGVAGYSNLDSTRTSPTLRKLGSDDPFYITPILGVGLKLYSADRISIEAIGSLKLRSNFDTTYLYHYEIGTRIYINDLLNLKLGYSQVHLGGGNIKRMQIGLGVTF